MLKYDDLIDAPVAKLKSAVDDWDKMASDLDKLADDAAKGMKVKSDKADWEGLNAGVTKAFVTKTAKEFADAAAEAKGVKAILEEGHAAIKKAKDDLINIRDHEGPAAGIKVDGKGTVTARHPVQESLVARHDPDYSAMLQQRGRTSSRGRRGSTSSSTTATTPTCPSRTPSKPMSPIARTSPPPSTRRWTRRRPPGPPALPPRAATSRTRSSRRSTSC